MRKGKSLAVGARCFRVRPSARQLGPAVAIGAGMLGLLQRAAAMETQFAGLVGAEG